MIRDMSLSNPIKMHPLSATDEIFPGIHYKKNLQSLTNRYQSCQSDPQDSINLQNR